MLAPCWKLKRKTLAIICSITIRNLLLHNICCTRYCWTKFQLNKKSNRIIYFHQNRWWVRHSNNSHEIENLSRAGTIKLMNKIDNSRITNHDCHAGQITAMLRYIFWPRQNDNGYGLTSNCDLIIGKLGNRFVHWKYILAVPVGNNATEKLLEKM